MTSTWPTLPTLRIPAPARQRRTWNNENWPDRYRRQHMELLSTAARIAGEVGYTKTQVADIVEQASFSKRTFYEHFESKEDCFAQLSRRATVALLRLVIAVFEERIDDGPQAAISAFMGAWVSNLTELARQNPTLLGLDWMVGSTLSGEVTANRGLLAQVLAVAARRLDSPLPDDELGLVAHLMIEGISRVLTPAFVAEPGADAAVGSMARSVCRALGFADRPDRV